MAFQVTSAGAPPTNIISALNAEHQSHDFTGLFHFDGTEVNPAGVEQYISLATPTDYTSAALVVNQAKALYNLHLTYSNGGNGIPCFAHKVTDAANIVTEADIDPTTVYSTIFNAIKTLYLAVRTSYVNHISNLRPNQTAAVFHTGADTVDVLGAVPTIVDESDLVVDMNNLKAQYNLHRVNVTGVHAFVNTDSVTSPNAVAGSIDTSVTLANELKTKLNLHFADAVAHTGAFGADTENVIAAASVSYPSGLYDLINQIYTKYELHRVSTTYHNTADSTNDLNPSLYPVSTITGFISAAVDMQTNLNAHFRGSLTYSKAVRLV